MHVISQLSLADLKTLRWLSLLLNKIALSQIPSVISLLPLGGPSLLNKHAIAIPSLLINNAFSLPTAAEYPAESTVN